MAENDKTPFSLSDHRALLIFYNAKRWHHLVNTYVSCICGIWKYQL